MAIQLFDTLTRQIKPLQASDSKHFRFYCCGPTVYGPAHIGNFRTFLLQDVLRRILEIDGMNPIHARNLTDVDDKTIKRSKEEGLSLQAFTQKWTDIFHADCKALNMLPPHIEPTATGHIPQMIKMINTLVEKKHAYVSPDGSVYYKIDSFQDYGKLSHLHKETLKTQETTSSGSANLADEYNRESIADFALWKSHKPEDGPNSWDTPWGKGRPGWHIECSAMCKQHLGDTFDLHAGGIDLCFPHHENEIAQSEGANEKPLAHHWFHTAHLQVDGQKMSKSLGNLFTLKDIQQKGYPPPSLRYVLISGHYRQPLNFTFESLQAAQSALKKIEKSAVHLLQLADLPPSSSQMSSTPPPALPLHTFEAISPPPFTKNWGRFKKAWDSLCHDLNTPAALGNLFTALHKLESSPPPSKDAAKTELIALAQLLYALGVGIFQEPPPPAKEIPQEIQELAQKRWEARVLKNFALSDELRKELEKNGWKVLDQPNNYLLEPIIK